jgi:hypothetical protein
MLTWPLLPPSGTFTKYRMCCRTWQHLAVEIWILCNSKHLFRINMKVTYQMSDNTSNNWKFVTEKVICIVLLFFSLRYVVWEKNVFWSIHMKTLWCVQNKEVLHAWLFPQVLFSYWLTLKKLSRFLSERLFFCNNLCRWCYMWYNCILFIVIWER